MATRHWYILLKDRIGECFKDSFFSKIGAPYTFAGGEILVCSPGSEQPKDPKRIALRRGNIRLECSKLDVSQLTDSEVDLLDPVLPYEERLRIYRDKNLLSEAKLLDIGSNVFVKIRKHHNTELELRGVIRYKGSLDGFGGTWFGVELLDKESLAGCYIRVSDGTHLTGKRYFTCPADRGIFVAVDKLRPQQDQDQEERIGQKSDGRFAELVTSLDEERKIREEVERRLYSSERRSHELLLSLASERQAREETERRLRINEQRLNQSETSLSAERQAHQKTERRLRSYEQRLEEFEATLVEETQAHQETESHLQSSEMRLQELQGTLTTVRQAYEDYQRSIESTRDWIVSRDEIILSDNVIGVGAWGEVKEGTFRGCKVAVKKIHELILSDHNRRLFEREMNMASRCRHPCLLQFIGATNDDQSPLFVTELLDTSLRSVLHDRPLEPLEITTIALDVAKALNYLHLSHPDPIIHRDISSANVLLWKHVPIWRAKVSDYGTANFLQQSMTATPGAVIYSAPEAQTSRQSPKLDVYSFGVLLCEMNVRQMPDVERRNVQVAMVTNNLFRNLIRRCLRQNPEERPSMAEIIETLENTQQ